MGCTQMRETNEAFCLRWTEIILCSLQQSKIINETLNCKITFNKGCPAHSLSPASSTWTENSSKDDRAGTKQAVDQTLMTNQAGHLSKIFRFAVNLASAETISKVPIWSSSFHKTKQKKKDWKKSLINSTKQSAQLIKANPSELLVGGPMQREPSIG